MWSNHKDEPDEGCNSSSGPIAMPHTPPLITLCPLGGYWTIQLPAVALIWPQTPPEPMWTGRQICRFQRNVIMIRWVHGNCVFLLYHLSTTNVIIGCYIWSQGEWRDVWYFTSKMGRRVLQIMAKWTWSEVIWTSFYPQTLLSTTQLHNNQPSRRYVGFGGW